MKADKLVESVYALFRWEGANLKINLKVDDKYTETKVTIECHKVDDTIQGLINYVKEQSLEFIIGKNGEMSHIIQPDDVHYFHTENNAVVAVTSKGSFRITEKLYELENTLADHKFIRISKSVIVNLYEIDRFEASFNGTLCVHFKSGENEYVSRTYVNGIKQALKMNRRKKQ